MNKSILHGFEEYTVIIYNYLALTGSIYRNYADYGNYFISMNSILVNNYEQSDYILKVPSNDCKDILNNAKSVYIYPSCTMPRTIVNKKYKLSRDLWNSDVVIIPDISIPLRVSKTAIFINDDAKIIVFVKDMDCLAEGEMPLLTKDTKLKDVVTFYSWSGNVLESADEAKFECIDTLINVPLSNPEISDYLLGVLPHNKIVYESTFTATLNDESNKPDADTLLAILEMLESSDSDTVSAALKALSMLDYTHYKQSIKYILLTASGWRYNKAMNSTSVKYMFTIISGSCRSRRYLPGSYDDEITEEDYELFKQLYCKRNNIDAQKMLSYMRAYNFMGVSPEGFVCPRLKQRD